jgi:Tfp pilus assembly protein PilN
VHELEFLPTWYPHARRRQRLLRLELVTAILLVMGLCLWMLLARHNVAMAWGNLSSIDGQLAQSQLELDQLQVQLKLQAQLQVQQQIMSKLGLPVEMSRLIRTIGRVMPKEMSLQDITFDTVELESKSAAGNGSVKPGDAQRDRRLRAHLVGVAPSDVDLANFLAGLTNIPFFQDVTMTYAKDKSASGHLMREFEVTFTMNLNSTIGEP